MNEFVTKISAILLRSRNDGTIEPVASLGVEEKIKLIDNRLRYAHEIAQVVAEVITSSNRLSKDEQNDIRKTLLECFELLEFSKKIIANIHLSETQTNTFSRLEQITIQFNEIAPKFISLYQEFLNRKEVEQTADDTRILMYTTVAAAI